MPFDAGKARATIMRAETVIEATRAGELLPRFTDQSGQLALPAVRSPRAMLADVMNAEKIGKLIKMLSSPNDGEVVAAARAILRTLEAEGTDIHELAERVEGRKLSQAEMQRIYDKAFADGKKSAAADGGLQRRQPTARPSTRWRARSSTRTTAGSTPKEHDFVDDMVRWCARREPSEKQAKWLHAIYCRIGRRR